MEQNTNRLYWAIGVIVIASFLLFGSLKVFGIDLLPKVTGKINNTFKEHELKTWPTTLNGGNASVYSGSDEGSVDSAGFGQELLSDAKKMKLNTVTIPVVVAIDSQGSNSGEVLDYSLNRALALSKIMSKNGIRTIIEPYPLIADGAVGESYFKPNDKSAFMDSWTGNVLSIIDAFKDEPTAGIYIGSNLTQLEDQNEAFNSLIKKARSSYSGKIIYRTNYWYNAVWDEATTKAFQDKKATPFFKNVDILSVAAYFELSSPDVFDVKTLQDRMSSTNVYSRQQNVLSQIRELHEATGKEIMFGELGISNHETSMSQPWNSQLSTPVDDRIQSIWYRAWIEQMRKESWFNGYSIFAIGYKGEALIPNEAAKQTIASLN